MIEPYKIDRKLPPHELNARRNRKRVVTKLPAIADLAKHHHREPHHHEHHSSPNDTVYNPATNPVNNHQ